jgi:hypothetical protein
VRKPVAFRSYAFRDDLFPRLEYRRAYDALLADANGQADFEYVRILQLAATDGEEAVRAALAELLDGGKVPSYEAVRAKLRGARTPMGVPCLEVGDPDLRVYDRLLGADVAEAVAA